MIFLVAKLVQGHQMHYCAATFRNVAAGAYIGRTIRFDPMGANYYRCRINIFQVCISKDYQLFGILHLILS